MIFIYGQAKEATVKYHPEPDMVAHYDIKDPVCDIIHAGAEGWLSPRIGSLD